MAEIYLEPADVSGAHARIVLGFLNAAQSAQEIADRVEIPGEPDVGLRTGQHILDRRAQLGQFTDLQQVFDVQQVGRERFTEIIVTLTGIRPAVSSDVTTLHEDIQELRRTISGLRAGQGPTRFVDRTALPSRTRVPGMFDLSEGTGRVRLDGDELRRLRGTGAVVIGPNRRPFHFDGRFLTAADLNREQNYFLSRQATVARAIGGGVVNGLFVTRGPTATSIAVSSGHGVTGAGETVVISRGMRVDLGNIAEIQRLDRAFGLSRRPRVPARQRSGLFVVALRPVEFTANPIASYPTSIDGNRTVEDGDIVEGVVVTLIPYRDGGARNELDVRRAQMARELFVEGASRWKHSDALPLAIVAMDRGAVEWVDPYLMRREFGAAQKDILGLGFAPRVLRESHILQYDNHLQDILESRAALNQGRRFAAAEHLYTLPAAGRLPSAAIDSSDFTQVFFPPDVDVELTLVPDDEVAAMLEESLVLPPIDLTLEGEAQESTSVLVMAAVDRPRLRSLASSMVSLTRELRSAAPGLVAQRRPIEALRGLTRFRLPLPAERPEAIADGEWQTILAESDMLWYVRRRDVRLSAPVLATPTPASGDEVAEESALDARLTALRIRTAFNNLQASASARGAITSMLTAPIFLTGPAAIIRGAIAELAVQPRLDTVAVRRVQGRYARAGFGSGIQRLERADPTLGQGTTPRVLGDALIVPELDRLGTLITDAEMPRFIASLVQIIATPDQIAGFVTRELQQRLRPPTRPPRIPLPTPRPPVILPVPGPVRPSPRPVPLPGRSLAPLAPLTTGTTQPSRGAGLTIGRSGPGRLSP